MAGMISAVDVAFTSATSAPRSTNGADTTALIDGSAAPGASSGTADAVYVGRLAGGLVIGAVVLLWLLGGIVFRDARIG